MKLEAKSVVIESDLHINEEEKVMDKQIYDKYSDKLSLCYASVVGIISMICFSFLFSYLFKDPAIYRDECAFVLPVSIILSLLCGFTVTIIVWLISFIILSIIIDNIVCKKSKHNYETYENIEDTMAFLKNLIPILDTEDVLIIYDESELIIDVINGDGKLEQVEFDIEHLFFRDTDKIIIDFIQDDSKYGLDYIVELTLPKSYFKENM